MISKIHRESPAGSDWFNKVLQLLVPYLDRLDQLPERAAFIFCFDAQAAAVKPENGEVLNVSAPGERSKARVAAAGMGTMAADSVSVPVEGIDMESYVADLERSLLQSALRQSGGVQTRAAELLKLSYRSFRHLAKKYTV